MQSKIILNKLKKIERKLVQPNRLYIFFGEPNKKEIAKLPPNTNILIFVGEDEIQD